MPLKRARRRARYNIYCSKFDFLCQQITLLNEDYLVCYNVKKIPNPLKTLRILEKIIFCA